MNHPFSEYGAATRLLAEYKEHQKLVVGFDFDNTIFDTHNNGGNYKIVIDLLKGVQEAWLCAVPLHF